MFTNIFRTHPPKEPLPEYLPISVNTLINPSCNTSFASSLSGTYRLHRAIMDGAYCSYTSFLARSFPCLQASIKCCSGILNSPVYYNDVLENETLHGS